MVQVDTSFGCKNIYHVFRTKVGEWIQAEEVEELMVTEIKRAIDAYENSMERRSS